MKKILCSSVLILFYSLDGFTTPAPLYCGVTVGTVLCSATHFVDDFVGGDTGLGAEEGTAVMGGSGVIQQYHAGASGIKSELTNYNPLTTSTASNIGSNKLMESSRRVIDLRIMTTHVVNTTPNDLHKICYAWMSKAWERPCDYVSSRFVGKVYKCIFKDPSVAERRPNNLNNAEYWGDLNSSVAGTTYASPSEVITDQTYRNIDCRTPDKNRRR